MTKNPRDTRAASTASIFSAFGDRAPTRNTSASLLPRQTNRNSAVRVVLSINVVWLAGSVHCFDCRPESFGGMDRRSCSVYFVQSVVDPETASHDQWFYLCAFLSCV